MSGPVWVGSRIVEPTNSRNVQFTGASSASNIPNIVPTRIGTLLTTLLRTRSSIVYRMSAGKSSVLPSPNPSRRNTPNTNIVPKVLDRYQLVQVPPKQITPLLFPTAKMSTCSVIWLSLHFPPPSNEIHTRQPCIAKAPKSNI